VRQEENLVAILGVLALLYALHRFTGPHEIRRPVWNVLEEGPAHFNKAGEME
jgi:hypothetical protein